MGKKNPNVSRILQDVHDTMKMRYSPSGVLAKDISQAQILTNFLQVLKERAYNYNNINKAEKIQNDMYDMILDNIKLPNNRTLHNLFRRIGKINKVTGQYFEDDLAAVVASIVNLANPDKHYTYKNFSFGNIAGTTDIDLLKETEEEMDDYVEELVYTTQEELEKNKPGFVLGKIDTAVKEKIINLNAEIDIPEALLDALSNATFTDKSYRSVGWDKTLGKQVDLGDRIIHFGNSNPYRAVLGSMSMLGFTKEQSMYVFYGGRNISFGKDTDPPIEDSDYVNIHIYHLRYLYELTGAGILYKNYGGDFSQGAKFLVYNDPNSAEILCVATSQIIAQILNSDSYPDNPFGAIGLSKKMLRTISQN